MKTIMIIDDEFDVLKNVKNCLEENNFEVVTANNSREALEMLDENKENNYGLILIDTPMPGSNSTALFSMNPKLKTDTDKLEDFLQKPFTQEQLLDFVKNRLKIS
jgi:DNA-binding NtrC family response regulator